MKITDELIQKSNGIISLHPEVNDWTGKNFAMFDDGGVELETGEFLYGLVRITKPENILETGTYTGISAMYMGQGLKDNGFGNLETVEFDQTHKTRAEALWKAVGVDQQVRCTLMDARKFKPEKTYDLMFLDSEPDMRFDEMVRFLSFLKKGGYLFIHDLHRHMSQEDNPQGFGWPFGKLPMQIIHSVWDDEIRPFHFPTPRGLVGFYKVADNDYHWKRQ